MSVAVLLIIIIFCVFFSCSLWSQASFGRVAVQRPLGEFIQSGSGKLSSINNKCGHWRRCCAGNYFRINSMALKFAWKCWCWGWNQCNVPFGSDSFYHYNLSVFIKFVAILRIGRLTRLTQYACPLRNQIYFRWKSRSFRIIVDCKHENLVRRNPPIFNFIILSFTLCQWFISILGFVSIKKFQLISTILPEMLCYWTQFASYYFTAHT